MKEPPSEKVLAALTQYSTKRGNGNWSCPGEAHHRGDVKPSLTVTFDGDKVLLYCHAGCHIEDVLKGLGLEMSDLVGHVERREVASYLYKDLDGTVLYRKTRYEPKDFLVWHPLPNGEWAPRLGDTKKVLYNLPELRGAITRGETVYVVEGEKDADRMMQRGYVATCNYEGAAVWQPGYAQWFKDADVVIVADRDEIGYQHAKEVKQSILGIARSVRVMQSAVKQPKADISDHFDKGWDVDTLEPLSGAFRPVHLGQLVKNGVEAPKLLADGMLYQGGLHCIAGAPDCGKTTLALYWAVQLLKEGYTVAFFDEEGGSEIVAEKLVGLGAETSDMNNLVYVPFPGKMWDDSDIEALMEFLKDSRPVMALWDSSAAFLARAGLDENSAPAVTNWWARVLTPVARELHAAVVVIDHDTKASEQSRYARGSGAKLAALDVQYKVELKTPFTRHQNGELKLFVTKDRRGHLERDWVVEVLVGMDTINPVFSKGTGDRETDTYPPAKRKVFGVLTNEFRGTTEILSILHEFYEGETPMTRETACKALNDLCREGRVAKSKDGHDATWKLIR